MGEVKRCLSEGWVLASLFLGCFAAGVFGAVNWSDYVYPEVPDRGRDDHRGVTEPQETFDLRVAEYNRKLDEVGKSAVITFPTAVTVCLTGFLGVAVSLFALIVHLETIRMSAEKTKHEDAKTSATHE